MLLLLTRLASPTRSVVCRSLRYGSMCMRTLSTVGNSGKTDQALRRSYLYVPSSSDRMLDKSLSTPSDIIIFDLEDSVPPSPHDKDSARQRLSTFLSRTPEHKLPHPERIAVRLNDITTPFFRKRYIRNSQVAFRPNTRAAQDPLRPRPSSCLTCYSNFTGQNLNDIPYKHRCKCRKRPQRVESRGDCFLDFVLWPRCWWEVGRSTFRSRRLLCRYFSDKDAFKA